MVSISSTIKDIATACGVSAGTVDRALNNRGGINEETKNRIMKAASELDYQPNHVARCLATGSTNTIGVVCVNLSNNFYSQLIEEIEQIAKENGYFINLILSHNDAARELEGIQYLARRKVDGLIIFPIGIGEEYEHKLKKLNVPIVTLYNRISEDFVHVDVNCRQAMKNAVAHIVQRGYRRIIYLNFGIQELHNRGLNTYSREERLHGYLDGIKDELLEESMVIEEYHPESLIELVNPSQGVRTAFLCPSDIAAIRVLNLLREQGIKVPEQVGIMGFDNTDMLNMISPRIQSVDCKIRYLGRKAFTLLLKLINKDENVLDCVVGYSFTEGETL